MSNAISLPCQFLAGCGCAYLITPGTNIYNPPTGSPYAAAMGWQGDNMPTVVVGGVDNEDAALVGVFAFGGLEPAILVAFEGTLPPYPITLDSFLAWVQNLIAEPKAEGNLPGLVHPGIYDSMNNLYTGIVDAISGYLNQYPGIPVYITGHSKGGGMASLFAEALILDNSNPIVPTAVYTYASPMVGNADFVNGYNTQFPVYRYENNLDMVPFLAPSSSFISTLKGYENGLDTLVLDAIVLLFESVGGDGNWGYVPLGQLNFVDGTSVTQPSTNPCAPDIGAALANNIAGLEEVLNAHSHLCGQGYMNGICNGSGVCPVS
jgi:hypothetical protein